jgi:5-(carboxyamino)imidazole ribonucleotide mutase
MVEYATAAKERGIGAIIAGAGGAAHVAGVTAALTTVPVIGVPIKTSALGGLDSLLSIVQMPGGIPVSTTAINGAKNAALIAASIFALTDKELEARLVEFRKKQTEAVLNAEL